MYRFWAPVVKPLLERLDPRVMVEIGSDQGFNTRNLIEFASLHNSVLHVVDPLPKYDVEEWLKEYSHNVIFHRATSHAVLDEIDAPDVVLIDGDHNWHTVIGELRILAQAGASTSTFPVVLLHDVGWPYGRRDLYYEPERIPLPTRQPHRKAGLRPERRDLDPDGGLNAHLNNAELEGGVRNGVRTAVEDFVAESALDLTFVAVPGINGLGVLYLPSAVPDAVNSFISDLHSSVALSGLLEKVESLRLEAQIDLLDTQRDSEAKRRMLGEQSARAIELERRLDKVQTQLNESTRDLLRAEREKGDLAAAKERAVSELSLVRDQLRDQSEGAAKLRTNLAESRSRLKTTREALKKAERSYKRLRSRRSVRLVLRLAAWARPFIRYVRQLKRRQGALSGEPPLDPKPGLAAPVMSKRDQARLIKAVIRERPGSNLTEGPLVSIIVLTRDGAHHLRRLLPALDNVTTYRSFELIVVDNASTDDSAEVLAGHFDYQIHVLRNESNRSFSEACNQGVDAATGELLLFLNNDIEPVNPGWLGAMVEAANSEGNVAAGAVLVYPVLGQSRDLTVQHAGIEFGFRDGAVHPINIQASDPLDGGLKGVRRVPGATAAALMVDATAFTSVGGFDESYVYGTEDVDLCLKLRAVGEIVVTGQAVLFHHESATQRETAVEVTRINRLRNHQYFAESWGPILSRSVRSERIAGGGQYQAVRQPTLAVTLTRNDAAAGWGDYYTAHGLGEAFARRGWQVLYAERYADNWYEIETDVDLVISLLDTYDVRLAPTGAFTIAWVRNWVDRWLSQPWFDSFDLVVTSSYKAADLISEQSRFTPKVIPMATDPEHFIPGPENPTFRSDYLFTGNNWGAGRSIVDMLDVHPEETFLIFGKGWEDDPKVRRYWRDHLDHGLLPQAYRSTKIVLDDTATPTLPYAFVNGRVFDALASGALVLSDNVEGSKELFHGLLPTYRGREELRRQMDHFLSNEGERREVASHLRAQILELHTYERRVDDFIDTALSHIDRPKAAIKIAVPNREVMENWGDTHFANGLSAALTALGMPTEVHILPEWDAPASQVVDVAIHLRGLSNYVPKLAQINVLWIISHPDNVTVRECEKYDVVFVASRQHSDWLKTQVSVPVFHLPQATDHRRFHPREADPELAVDVLFLGNSRGQRRPAVDMAIQAGLPLRVYGSGWEGRIPRKYLAGDHFPNEQLGLLYASAKVVLNDHWPDMRDRGFVSNRIFDVLGSGGVVVSDDAVGLKDLFGDIVATSSSAKEMSEVVARLLADDAERAELGQKGAELVLADHSFQKRAGTILEVIRPLLAGRPKNMSGERFEDAKL